MPENDWKDDLKRAISLFQKVDEDEDGGEYDLLQAVPSVFKVHDYEDQGDRPVGTIDCGSVRVEDTPAAMYRALFVFRPKCVRPKDMYKGTFLTIVSPDYAFVASIEFYKYEIGIYFSAAEGHVEGRGSAVVSGLPGSDNGVRVKGNVASSWFTLLIALLARKWSVYSGNNFEV